jgi:Uma2 family endonuclease
MAILMDPQDQRVVLRCVHWETYTRLVADLADSSASRLTYDRGTLEIMSPLPEHERYNRAIASIVEIVADEWDIDFDNLGSTTLRREDLERGFEPDSCFYVRNAEQIQGKRQIDLTVDPPPDLVIEIDLPTAWAPAHSSLDKLALYASMGIPELWRYDGQSVRIQVLESGAYQEQKGSRALSGLDSAALSTMMDESKTLGRKIWLRRVRAWARERREGNEERT